MERSELSVCINRALSDVFAIYTQADLWRWTDFQSAVWTHGHPWALGSRLRVEPSDAYGVVVSVRSE